MNRAKRESLVTELGDIEKELVDMTKRVLAVMRVILRETDVFEPPTYLVVIEHDGKQMHIVVKAEECEGAVRAAVKKRFLPPCRQPKNRLLPRGYELVRCTLLNTWQRVS